MYRSHFITSQRVLIGNQLVPAGIFVEDGTIKKITGADEKPITGFHVHDYGEAVIFPGLIDAHVHINEPGRTHWEGFRSATKAAAAGGISLIIDMPLNSSPVTINTDTLEQKQLASHDKLSVDVGFYGGIVPGNEAEMESLLEAGVAGIKAFLCHSGIDEFPNAGENELLAIMPKLSLKEKPLLVHAELADNILRDVKNPQNYVDYAQTRPQQWEVNAIRMLVELCKKTGCRVHIVHLAAATALPLLELARSEGLPITVETAPHYLFFDEATVPDGDARYKCAPPIRSSENREQLWDGLKKGIIDFIATDHSPSPPEMKSKNLMESWGGISSLQLLLPATWTAARPRGFEIPKLAEWLSSKPASFLGLQSSRGEIAVGKRADFCIWHPEKSFIADQEKLEHRHKLTPYHGAELFGVVESTWLNGNRIFHNGKFSPKKSGQPTNFT